MRLTLFCRDRPGIVAKISALLFQKAANIDDAQQYNDQDTGLFFMRVVFDLPATMEKELRGELDRLGQELEFRYLLRHSQDRRRVMILTSGADHCLADLLYRWRGGELPMEISAIVSNHPRERFTNLDFGEIGFHYLPVCKETKLAQETALWQLIQDTKTEIIVLAVICRSCRIAWPRNFSDARSIFTTLFFLVLREQNPIIKPNTRGVKIIGATAHFVTADLDEGPIIEQDVEHITHRDRPEDLIRKGRDIERIVLARALRWILEDRVFINGQRTVVFRD